MNVNKKTKVAAAILTILASMGASQVNAAEETAVKKHKSTDIEIITVTGIKGSIAQSMNDKRFSSEIMDGISAEDIGQLPDENIAEALQRVTGIQMSRSSDGEGSTIQIRGISNNNVEVNGQTLSGSADDRSVNFQDIPSELVSGVEVLKAPTSDKIEGSLGATVNLKTRRPLGIQEDQIVTVTAKAKYAELSGETDPDVSFLLGKNFRETAIGDFGFIVNGGSKTISTLTEAFGGGDYKTAQGIWYLHTAKVDLNGDELLDDKDRLYAPEAFRLFSNERESVRNSFNTSLQWQPNDEINLFFDAMFTESEQDVRNAQYSVNFNKGLALPMDGGDNQFFSLGNSPMGDHHVMMAGRLGGGTVTSGSAPSLNTTWRESEQFTLGGDIQVTDELNISAELSTSDAKAWNEQSQLTMGWDADLNGKLKGNDFTRPVDFNMIGVDLADVTLYESAANLVALDPTDTSYEHMFYEKYQRNAGNNDNTSDAFRIDATYEFDDGIITQVSAGARWAERTFAHKGYKHNNKGIQGVPVYPLNSNNKTNLWAQETSVAFRECLGDTQGTALSNQSGDMPRSWTSTTCDIDFFTEYFDSDDIRGVNPDTGAGIYEKTFERFNITEETMAYYLRVILVHVTLKPIPRRKVLPTLMVAQYG